MLQIGYFSTASGPQDAAVVHRILGASRQANARNFITGLLVAGGGHYLQVIEGPDAAVETLFRSIEEDNRHMAVASFCLRKINERSFKSWAMAFRRPTLVSQPNSFIDVLKALTSDIPDSSLKYQINYFVQATMMSDAMQDIGVPNPSVRLSA